MSAKTSVERTKDNETIKDTSKGELANCKVNAEPITQYENQQQLNESLKEWQTRLGLSDWIITAKVTEDFTLVGMHGECVYNRVSRLASIHMKPYYKLPHDEWMAKQPQEQVLVHELLHCIIFTCEEGDHTIELENYNICQHQILDQMATALIMAKYNITIDWFKV